MTTDLATVASQLPAHLRGVSSQSGDEFTGGIGGSFPLAFLSIRGKEFRLRKDGQELNTRQRDLSVILVAARPTLSKRFYKDKYSSGNLIAPDCSSKDSVTPDVAEPVAPNCTHCPNNQWGSLITESGKQGKACSDYKRMVVWPVGLSQDPLVMDVPATSLKAPKGQKHTVLMLGDYLTQLTKHGMNPTHVVTKVSFTDAEYPQLCFTFERFVTEDELAKVLELRDSEDVKTVIDSDTFEPARKVDQVAAPAPETPKPDAPVEPAGPPFPGKPTIMKRGDDMMIAEDAEGWVGGLAAGYLPVESTKPKAEPEPEPEAPKQEAEAENVSDAGADDILAEVQKLLAGG